MPRLKQYTNGRGYYLTGHIPDVGFCTWQIGSEGLAYLAARGISASGDSVRIEDIRTLLDRGLIGTEHGGPSGTAAASGPEWVRDLSDRLAAWSVEGGVEALTRIVCPGGGAQTDHRPRCFPTSFLTWASGMDQAAGPARLAGIAAAEFESLAADVLDELGDDPLFGDLINRGAVGTVWRLARVVGSVAVQLRTSPNCPDEWRGMPLLQWLFTRLRDRQAVDPTGHRRTGPRRPTSWSAPWIVWDVDLQEVVAVLPAQLLPAGAAGVSWRVCQGQPVHPLVRPGPRGRVIEESVSNALPPADTYDAELTPSGQPDGRIRWSIICPRESPLLLFHTDGRLVDCEAPDPLTPGRYLALVRPGAAVAVKSLHGFTTVEPIPVGPRGWNGWSGCYADLDPGASIPGYRVAAEAPVLRWEIEIPPESGVRWLETCPVFIGSLPRITVEPADAFRGAVLEVTVGGMAAVEAESFYLTLGKDVPLSGTVGPGVADLNAAPQLRGRYGRFRLRCQPASRLDHPALTLGFTRLPAMRVEYVPDPLRPSSATAVLMTPDVPVAGLVAGPDTDITPAPARGPISLILRSTRPESAPGVIARLPAEGWEIRVRVSISRACLITRHDGFGGWMPLPVRDIDFGSVELGDRLRLEFHTPPVLEDGRLVSRLQGRGELLVGEPLDRSGRPTVFQIDLHRWRDGFGVGSCGVVQVRGGSGWIDVAALTAPQSDQQPPGPVPEEDVPWWTRLASELGQAVRRGDVASASELIDRCLATSAGPQASPCAADLLPLTAAEAALVVRPPSGWAEVRTAVNRLAVRDDLPEAKVFAATFAIRSGPGEGVGGEWSLSRVEEVKADLPNARGAAVVLAECWYRLARSAGQPAAGCWRSCLELCNRYLTHGGCETGLAFSDALLLRDLACLMLRADPASGPAPTDVLPGHRGWIEAIRLAGRFLRQPWHGRANREPLADLTSPAPTVLCREDEALVRFLVAMVTGSGEPERYWPLVSELSEGYFYALPLLRARYARSQGDLTTAEEEYNRAWAVSLAGEHNDFLDVIAAERP